MSNKLVKKLIIGAYERQLFSKTLDKNKKKGELVKILNSNKKRSNTLVEIFKSNVNVSSPNKTEAAADEQTSTNEEKNVNDLGDRL